MVLNPVLKAQGADDPLQWRDAGERSRDCFMRVLLLVDALPNKIALYMEDWFRVGRVASFRV